MPIGYFKVCNFVSVIIKNNHWLFVYAMLLVQFEIRDVREFCQIRLVHAQNF